MAVGHEGEGIHSLQYLSSVPSPSPRIVPGLFAECLLNEWMNGWREG